MVSRYNFTSVRSIDNSVFTEIQYTLLSLVHELNLHLHDSIKHSDN